MRRILPTISPITKLEVFSSSDSSLSEPELCRFQHQIRKMQIDEEPSRGEKEYVRTQGLIVKASKLPFGEQVAHQTRCIWKRRPGTFKRFAQTNLY